MNSNNNTHHDIKDQTINSCANDDNMYWKKYHLNILKFMSIVLVQIKGPQFLHDSE